MRIFLSYASRDRALAESIHLALRAQRHRVFFDRSDLPPGEEYDIQIRRAIQRAHLFLFLVSSDSLRDDSYARTELSIAQRTWSHPSGRVLPVLVEPLDPDALPPYLTSVTLLEPAGHMPAAVGDAVHRLAVARRWRIARAAVAAAAVAGAALAGGYAYWVRTPATVATGRDGATGVLVPAGRFTMGDDEHMSMRDVYVDAFSIDEHEVSVGRYARFLDATGAVNRPDGWPSADTERLAALPVVGVDWHDADQYCRWADGRLPTEAEWEKAARGDDRRMYPWGDEEPTPEHAVFGGDGSVDAYAEGLRPVGSHPRGQSPYGVHDLTGNVSEWVADWHAEAFERADVRNPRGPADGDAKVIRGGGWYDPPQRLAVTRRMSANPRTRLDDVGFRCARDASSPR